MLMVSDVEHFGQALGICVWLYHRLVRLPDLAVCPTLTHADLVLFRHIEYDRARTHGQQLTIAVHCY